MLEHRSFVFNGGSSALTRASSPSGCILPSGAYTFACRKTCRLAYRSQRETPRDRALSGAFALRRKLGADGGIGDYVTKPRGMHWRTFERAMERIDRAEGIVEGTPFSCSIASTGSLPDSKPQDGTGPALMS
jgi:hypothetical protein